MILERLLSKTIAEGQGLRQEETDDSGQQTAKGWFEVTGNIYFPEQRDGAVKGLDVKYP